MSAPLPIVLQPVPVSYSVNATDINQLLTVLCQHVQATVNTQVSFFLVVTSDPTTLVSQVIFNQLEGVFKQWSVVLGKYVVITSRFAVGDLKQSVIVGDYVNQGWIQCDGRLISAVPYLSADQISQLEALFGAGGNLPNIAPITVAAPPTATIYTFIYCGTP
jgi:hypothetical protein